MTNESPTVSALFVKRVASHLMDMGCSEKPIKRTLGEHFAYLDDATYRIPVECVTKMYDSASSAMADPLLGVKLGYRVSTMQLGLLGNLLITASTLGKAISTLIDFSRLVTEVFYFDLRDREDMVELVFSATKPGTTTYHQADALVATLITLLDKLVPERACWVELEHEDLGMRTSYEVLYRCPVLFDKEVNKVVFPRKYLDVRAGWFDEELFEAQVAKANAAMHSLNSEQSLVEQVEIYIKERLMEGEPNIQDVSEYFNIGERTLQTKLKREGTSFRKILNSARESEAKSLLIAGFHTNHQIAERIGFNDVRNFYAAFKRWTGMTPQEYVREQRTTEVEPG